MAQEAINWQVKLIDIQDSVDRIERYGSYLTMAIEQIDGYAKNDSTLSRIEMLIEAYRSVTDNELSEIRAVLLSTKKMEMGRTDRA